jgi:prepilin-type N-terminal cleavage/methylation domain-containing protein/prepilin-type processing-associated H-X9-DG protein
MKRADSREKSQLSRRISWRCFTLIELLITIAIISLLASMLAPSLKSARDRAKDIKCVSNLRQIYLATMLYVNDHNGFYPVLNPANPTLNANFQWRQIEYFSNTISTPEIYRCPFRNSSNGIASTFLYGGGSGDQFNGKDAWTEYKMNDDYYQLMTNNMPWGRQLRPHMVVIVTDIMDWEPRHAGKTSANFVFGDGRVEMLKQTAYWGPEPGRSAPWNWYTWGMYDL